MTAGRGTLVAAWLVLLLVPVLAADALELVDGTLHVEVTVTAIRDGTVHATSAQGELAIPLTDLRRIECRRQVRILDDDQRVRVVTDDGSTFLGRLASPSAPGRLGVESRAFGTLDLPLEALAGVRFDVARAVPGWQEECEARTELEDVLYLRSEATWVRVLGLVEAVDPSVVTITWEGDTRQVPIERLGGIVFAPAGGQSEATDAKTRVRIVLAAGDIVHGRITGADAEHIEVATDAQASARLPWAAVTSVTMLTDRIAYLSDREPESFVEERFFDRAWGLGRDRNVAGGALVLGRVTYEKGLGVHAPARVEYALDGKHTELIATVGLDDTAWPHATARLAVLLDGQEVAAFVAHPGTPPRRLRIPLGQARTLTLVAQTGEDGLDVGDLVNWADAQLIR